MLRLVAFLAFNEFLTHQVSSLLITDLRVPSKVAHEALLDCRYDLDGDALYDVKWYKDGHQFFRCTPTHAQDYVLEGIKIYYDEFPSIGSCSFRLTSLNYKSEGEYKCEVSTEGPAFMTVVRQARLKVVPVSQIEEKMKRIGGPDSSHPTSTFVQESNTTWNAYSSNATSSSHTWKCLVLKEFFILFIFLYVRSCVM